MLRVGLLGTFTFLAIPVLFIIFGFRLFRRESSPQWFKILGLGFVGAVIGLLINATYIDVFESSKIAYIFVILGALVIRGYELTEPEIKA